MSFSIHWFWLIHFIQVLIIIYIGYKTLFQYHLKSKKWNVFFILIFILFFISPVKIKNNNFGPYQFKEKSNHKILIPKKIDNSFKEKVNSIKGIQKKDLK